MKVLFECTHGNDGLIYSERGVCLLITFKTLSNENFYISHRETTVVFCFPTFCIKNGA